MSRTVAEWVATHDDQAIPPRVKDRIVEQQERICACGCGVKLGVAGEGIEFDHVTALINGGQHREGNLQALRAPCHAPKTRKDMAVKKKNASVRKKNLGFHRPKSRLPGAKGSGWKAKVGGGWEKRS